DSLRPPGFIISAAVSLAASPATDAERSAAKSRYGQGGRPVNTLKSAALVVVLLGVLYGVYVALNKPEPPPQAGQSAGDVAPPAIEFGGSATQTAPPFANSYDESPAASSGRAVRGGIYQPSIDPGSLPPPTSPGTSVPVDPTTAAASTLQRSTYE